MEYEATWQEGPFTEVVCELRDGEPYVVASLSYPGAPLSKEELPTVNFLLIGSMGMDFGRDIITPHELCLEAINLVVDTRVNPPAKVRVPLQVHHPGVGQQMRINRFRLTLNNATPKCYIFEIIPGDERYYHAFRYCREGLAEKILR